MQEKLMGSTVSTLSDPRCTPDNLAGTTQVPTSHNQKLLLRFMGMINNHSPCILRQASHAGLLRASSTSRVTNPKEATVRQIFRQHEQENPVQVDLVT